MADFAGAAFSHADFNEVTFSDDAQFVEATFSGIADFDRATFSSVARFCEATFSGDTYVEQATFCRDALFNGATFSGHAYVERTIFGGGARFDGATFGGDAGFDGATFGGDARFDGATFGGDARFDGATFRGDADFHGGRFERARTLGPLSVEARLNIDDCMFLERARLDVTARVVSAGATTFASGVLLRVRRAEIALDNADFARSSIVLGATSSDPEHDLPTMRVSDDRHVSLESPPRLVTVRGAQVAALTVSNVDLRACRFFGAHGLESLTLEGSCVWPRTPPVRRYADRETIAEEHPWRDWTDPYPSPLRGLRAATGPIRSPRRRSPGCIARYGRPARTTRTMPAPATCTTARWRCDDTPRPSPRWGVAGVQQAIA